MSAPTWHLAIGPREHGVVRYAVSVQEALAGGDRDHRLLRMDAPHDPMSADVRSAHLHVTDRLFGRTPPEAAEAVLEIVDRVSGPVSVTLHDLPQPSDGAGMQHRTTFYRRVADAAAGVIVSSRHEASLFADFVDSNRDVQVIPLMIPDGREATRPRPTTQTVGVLGFLYPGKGHIETVRALSGVDKNVGFLALGTPSPGHEHLADEIREMCAGSDRACEITGFLSDDELWKRAREVTVPVAHHRHVSASGSINAWISAGRRPLVPRTSYTEELASRAPGVVWMYPDEESALDAAIEQALSNPDLTWLDSSTVPSPTPAEVADAHERVLRQWHP